MVGSQSGGSSSAPCSPPAPVDVASHMACGITCRSEAPTEYVCRMGWISQIKEERTLNWTWKGREWDEGSKDEERHLFEGKM